MIEDLAAIPPPLEEDVTDIHNFEDPPSEPTVPEEADDKKFLTNEEILWLDLNFERANHFATKLDLLKVQEEKRKVEAEKIYMQIQYLRTEHERLKRPDPTLVSRISVINQRQDELSAARVEEIIHLREKYEIEEEGFGYDPESGEIVPEEK